MIELRHLLLAFGIALLTACSSDATNTGDPNPGGADDNAAGARNDDDGSVAGARNADDDSTAGAANDDGDDDDLPPGMCISDDQDGVVGGNNTVKLYITDTGFNVGTNDSGQPNIAVQNSANVTLTITNSGTTPHSFTIGCRPTGLPAECNQQTSCFPTDANVPAIDPGDSVVVTFKTPVVEGEYEFTSDEPGDDGLIGEFVLM